jgi:histone H3/H4
MAKLNFIQSSKVRRFMNERGMKVSKAYIEALDREVAEMMGKHERIARADRRKTVMVIDIDLPAKIASLSRDLHR